MIKTYEYRIYPTPQQYEQFNKTLGLCRLYWNTILFQKQLDNNIPLEGYKQVFTKYKPEALEWIKEVDSSPLAQMWNDTKCAFNAFFKNMRNKKKKFVSPPKFKSKKNPKNGFRYSSMENVRFKEGKLFITKRLGLIDGSFHCRFLEGRIKTTMIKKTSTGKWFVKICVEKRDEKKCENGKIIGIDWNCNDDSFLTMSDGTKVKCPRFLKRKEKRLAKLQRKQSKLFKRGKEEQSKNYQKQKLKVALEHERVSWQRKDWLHKLSRQLANDFEFVAVEDINLQSMAQMNHGKKIGDQGFGVFRSMIAYKGTLIKVNPAYTSQTCSSCGNRNSNLTLKDREWKCISCGSSHDRDINAAINIKNIAASTWGTKGNNACGGTSSPMKQESPKPFQKLQVA